MGPPLGGVSSRVGWADTTSSGNTQLAVLETKAMETGLVKVTILREERIRFSRRDNNAQRRRRDA